MKTKEKRKYNVGVIFYDPSKKTTKYPIGSGDGIFKNWKGYLSLMLNGTEEKPLDSVKIKTQHLKSETFGSQKYHYWEFSVEITGDNLLNNLKETLEGTLKETCFIDPSWRKRRTYSLVEENRLNRGYPTTITVTESGSVKKEKSSKYFKGLSFGNPIN